MKSKLLIILAIFALNYLSATTCVNKKSSKCPTEKEIKQLTLTETYQEYSSRPLAPQTEFEQLTVILTKYGNNQFGLPVIHYAILQNDVEAVDLLLKYGASPLTKGNGYGCIDYAIRTGSLELTKKFIEIGVSPRRMVDSFSPLEYAKMCHQPEIVRYLESLPG
jgi:hypothetical protein